MKLLTLLFLLPFTLLAQIMGVDEIDPNNVKPWNTNNSLDFEGIYSQGYSEGESQFILAIHDSIVCIQRASFDEDLDEYDTFLGWRKSYENCTNVSIVGNTFSSDQYNGEFVIYEKDGQRIACLKIYNNPTDKNSANYELCPIIQADKLDYFGGVFPETKFEIISDETLSDMIPEALQIMRNEIYARYGYTFRKGGEMASYFNNQNWYAAEETNVDNWLTDIEKQNVENIQRIEKYKSNNK